MVAWSYKVIGNAPSKVKITKQHQLMPFSVPLSFKITESMANLTSQLYGDLLPDFCLSRGDGAI